MSRKLKSKHHLFFFVFLIISVNSLLHSEYLPVEGYPEVQYDLINDRRIAYYFKYDMGKDRTAYIAIDNTLIVESTSSGRVASLSAAYSINHSDEKHRYFKNMKVKLSKSKVEFSYDVNKTYYSGKEEIKTKSMQKEVVGHVDLSYKFSKTGIKYEAKLKAEKSHALNYSFYVRVPTIIRTDEERDSKTFKKNRKKSTTKLYPVKGKPFEMGIFDDDEAFKEKRKKAYGKKTAGYGYSKIELNKRLGFSKLSFASNYKSSPVHIHVLSGYTAYRAQSLSQHITDHSKDMVRFKYKIKESFGTGAFLKKNKSVKTGGELKIK